MKKILLVISVLLLIPSYSIADQAATPAHDATPSAWLGWFKSLRRPTKQDSVRAWHYVQSKWRCMMHGEKCSKRHRNALRTLSAITTIVLMGTVNAFVKYLKSGATTKADKAAAVADAAEAFRTAADAVDAFKAAADAADDAADAADDLKAAARSAVDAALQAAAKVFPELQAELKGVNPTVFFLNDTAYKAAVADKANKGDALRAAALKAKTLRDDADDAADIADIAADIAAAVADAATATATATAFRTDADADIAYKADALRAAADAADDLKAAALTADALRADALRADADARTAYVAYDAANYAFRAADDYTAFAVADDAALRIADYATMGGGRDRANAFRALADCLRERNPESFRAVANALGAMNE